MNVRGRYKGLLRQVRALHAEDLRGKGWPESKVRRSLRERLEQDQVWAASQLVDRGRTALHRNELSAPFKAIEVDSLLHGRSIFDYGCGHGSDVATLRARGVKIRGFDPAFTSMPRRFVRHDIVVLGYVLNVIEDPGERDAVLRRAWRMARQLLVIAVPSPGDLADLVRPLAVGDGYLTNAATFQRAWTPEAFVEYVSGVLGVKPEFKGNNVYFLWRKGHGTANN